MAEKIRRQSREKVYEGVVVDFYKDTMELPDGSTEVWDFVSHRNGAAAVVAADAQGRLLLVRQYRPAIERFTLELPAGKRDSVTEDTLVAAKRELSEETGYISEKWRKFLSLKTTVAFCDEFIDIYLAEDIQHAGAQHLDPSEDIDFGFYTVEELLEKIYACEIQDAKTVSGILAYANYVHRQ